MTDLTNAPAWVREIAERESKATKGPWEDVNGNTVFRGEECIAITPESGLSVMDTAFIANARTDIPRLIEAATGMAEVMEESMPEDCYAGRAMKAADCAGCEVRDMCGRGKALAALAKYRGEVGE